MTGCPNCGAQIVPDDEECWRCGSTVEADEGGDRETATHGTQGHGGPGETRNSRVSHDPGRYTGPAREREPRQPGRADPPDGSGGTRAGDRDSGYGRHQAVPAHEQVQTDTRGSPTSQPAGGPAQDPQPPAGWLDPSQEGREAGSTDRPLGRRGLLVGGGLVAAAAVGGWAVFRNSVGTEPGDSFETATPVRTGEYGPFEIVDGEKHYFQVELREGEQLTAEIAFENAAGDLDLAVYRAPDREGRVVDSASTSDDEQAVVTARESGTYYVVPDGYRSNGNEYELSIEVAEPTSPGSSVAAARPLSPGTYGPYRLSSGEEHYFAVDLDRGDELQVRITFAHREADLDLVVLGPDRAEVGSAASTSDNETVIVRASADGFYTVRVFPFDDGSTSYDLSISTG